MKKTPSNKIKNNYRIPFLLFSVAPPVIIFLIFYVYVNFSSILMAFTDRHGAISFENFIRFWEALKLPDSDLRLAFLNTGITFVILLVTYPFKVLVSYFIYKKVPFSGFYRIVFFMPTIIFTVATNIIFSQIIGPNGPIAQLIGEWLNLEYTPELLNEARFANKVVLLQLMWLSFPGDLILWGGTFARIPTDVLESGYIDGTTWWTEFTKIVVPMVWPTVTLQMVLLFCGFFSSTGNVYLLTRGDYGTETFSSWCYKYLIDSAGGNYSSNVYNYLSAVGLVTTIIAMVIGITIRKKMDQSFQEVEF